MDTNMEDIDGYGEESDDWMDVGERKDFVDMATTPGGIMCYFDGKPIKKRSKFGKDQFWFNIRIVIDEKTGNTGERILSTSSSKLRSGLKKVLEKYPDMLSGKQLVFIQWQGNGLDRSYDVGAIVPPWTE